MYNQSEHSSVLKVIDLLNLLSGIKAYSKKEIVKQLNLSERSFYRYLKTIREAGFVINNESGYYLLAKNTMQFKDLSSLLHFSEEEAYILNEAIHTIEASTKAKQNLISKLSALYDSDRVAAEFVSKENSSRIKPLLDAIKLKKQVELIDYQSSGSQSISTRLVEPFEFTPNYISVWCYEAESSTNKLFKISRIKKVVLMEDTWQFEDEHKANLLDCFRIGGESKIPVKVEMSLKARNLLIEEYPLSEQFIIQNSDNRYLFDGWITAPDGMGRFVLGLPGEFYKIETKELLAFIEKKKEIENIS